MKTSIVIGLGFGDEGKGRVVSGLSSHIHDTLVIRFNGGHQAGHTVIKNGHKHVFSSYGSGTFEGAHTYISQYCTVYPKAIMNEFNALWFNKDLTTEPRLYIHPQAMVTTPFDIMANSIHEQFSKHGTCGVGFGATVGRHEAYYKLYAQDLFNYPVMAGKINSIVKYYKQLLYKQYRAVWPDEEWQQKSDEFFSEVHELREIVKIEKPKFQSYKQIVFEGAQGVLLDMDFGFFPNVTRSNCTSKNAIQIINEERLPVPRIFHVTRAYQTRHGAGFMTNEGTPLDLINNENETNIHSDARPFRTGALDIDFLDYGYDCDDNFTRGLMKTLVINCVDQIPYIFPITKRTVMHRISARDICKHTKNIYYNVLLGSGVEISDLKDLDTIIKEGLAS